MSSKIISVGCDFLKTSTGKIKQGATPGAAFGMLSAIKTSNQRIGLKVSGGIRTTDDARQYISLAEQVMKRPVDKSWFRIGASSLANELI